ncbi:hypothetical protein BDP81DRAFT_61766 [Colletotrichum phormii]|uniref:Uncharacterized protein n=1 Tax=Colletotrichum phormii TaxID=359342 RepID=A0AAI9ZNE4_9PEZI|nr:uncharacterized protein BDP81DRAFT_61766 [Colletotrichum phormii]KAK1633839.1 hypothetical protein BDP81DRAFT_61766 [Colletotrichum phormii]
MYSDPGKAKGLGRAVEDLHGRPRTPATCSIYGLASSFFSLPLPYVGQILFLPLYVWVRVRARACSLYLAVFPVDGGLAALMARCELFIWILPLVTGYLMIRILGREAKGVCLLR